MDSISADIRKVTRKGKVNGSEVLDALSMLGISILNIVHVVHE